ncbi:unnamed protein product [Mytilus edulis]|uniref:Endonuclease/exonuclease/phosphatase domain-containing protein n=1 Tax=Mytilus edulis TaxID=6550 RepID=A0A8S3RKQ9_MYTED|nr:unnamed protein product [Mytilus edulis]
MRSANNKIKEIELVIENNTTAVSKCEARISKVSVVANETKTRLNSEASRITNISHIRSTGICSLKSKVLLLSDQVKDVDTAIEDFQTKVNSSMTSTSELRRRVVNVEKNFQASKREVMTYAAAAVQTADKSVSAVPLGSSIRPETPSASTSCPILPAHDRIHVSQETIHKTDTLPKKIVESTNFQANDTNSISVHFPRSVCNPKTSDFKGFTRTDERNPELLTCKGRSGVALLISKDIYPFTSLIEVNSDRIIGIEINIPNSEKYYVFSLYLPAVTQPYEYFRNEVDLLFELSSVYEEFGSVILMGDFNSKIDGPRCKIKHDERSKLCKTLMATHNLCSVNMELMCKGPVNTFQSYEDGPSTCIDHILINRTKLQHVKQAKVIDNHSFSTSDHHPIVCTLETESHLHHPQETSDPTVSWERARSTNSIEDYTFAVSTNLWTVNFPTTATPDVIESYYSCIVSAIKKAEKDTLPYKKFNRHSKPYWNPNLTVLRDSMRSIRNEWINNCHCHDTNSKTIESNLDIDQKTVWTIINNRKKKSSACSALVKDGVTYTDPKKINDIWLSHFQNVFSPSTYTDPKRETEITEKVSSIRKIVNRDQNNITFKLSDVNEICSKLKNNKACGHDGLFYEHIRYGGKLLIKHLHHLFNLCIKCAYIPNDWRKSMIILLYKGGNKPKTDTNSYRGISLVPSITKIFEKMVDLLLTLLRTDFPNVQQVTYQNFCLV